MSCMPWTISKSMPICSFGQDKKAKDVIDEMSTVTGFTENFPSRSVCAEPFRQGATAGGTRLSFAEGSGSARVRLSPLPQVQAITYFARAVGAARCSGDPAAAKAYIAKLAEMQDKLVKAKDSIGPARSTIQRQIATAWVLYAEGKRDEALKHV